VLGQPLRRLQQERAFANPRLAAEQDERARHHAPAQHAVELVDACGQARFGGVAELGERLRLHSRRARRARPLPRGRASPRVGATTSSCSVFHAPHSGHCPIQRGVA
jgi:hypothetical protein